MKTGEVNMKSFYDALIFFKLISRLKVKSALDAGMTIIKSRIFSRCLRDIEIGQEVVLDYLDFQEDDYVLPIYKAVFNNIYTLNDNISTKYDLINLLGRLENMSIEEQIDFLFICLELGSSIMYDIPVDDKYEFRKEQLGLFYKKSKLIACDLGYEYRVVDSLDVIKEIIVMNVESGNFYDAKQLIKKYKCIYKECEELILMEQYIKEV